jgi:hypothetical protein
VAQLYPQALGSLFVASYHSQGYGGGIRTRFHTEITTNLQSESELLLHLVVYPNQFVLAPSPLRITTRDFFKLNTCVHSPYITSSLAMYNLCTDRIGNTIFNTSYVAECVSVAKETCLLAVTYQQPSLLALPFLSLSYHVTICKDGSAEITATVKTPHIRNRIFNGIETVYISRSLCRLAVIELK